MWHLFDFLVRRYHYLLFLLLEILGIILLFRHNSYQSSVWFSSANAVSGKCYELRSNITSYLNLRETNRRLTTRNMLLEQQLYAVTRQLARLQKDSVSEVSAVPMGYHIINAQVVQNSIHKKDNLLTVNKGYADGVKKNMGVISGDGVVGIVYLAGAHYSVVIPVINSHSNISCSIRKRGYFGYLSWTGGDPQYAYLEDVPRYAHYSNGDIVQTSGYSTVFPPGITVGRVVCTFNSPDGLSYRIKLKLSADFANLYDVCIVDNPSIQEKLDILRVAQDSLSNK